MCGYSTGDHFCQCNFRVFHDEILLATSLTLKGEKGTLSKEETWSQEYDLLSLQKIFMSM